MPVAYRLEAQVRLTILLIVIQIGAGIEWAVSGKWYHAALFWLYAAANGVIAMMGATNG